MMDVPIGNQNALGAMLALRVAGRHRDAIKQAEAHAASAAGVVSGRPHNTESVLDPTAENGVDRRESAACRNAGGIGLNAQ